MSIDFVQTALKNLKPDNPDWYSWASTDSDGNVIPGDERMCWEHTVSIIDGVVKPTKSEFDAEVARLQAEYDGNAYQRTRALAYAGIKEQLDLLYHDMAADKGDKTGEWFKAIKAVKDATPKP